MLTLSNAIIANFFVTLIGRVIVVSFVVDGISLFPHCVSSTYSGEWLKIQQIQQHIQ